MNNLIKKSRQLTRKADLFLTKHGPKNFHLEARMLLENAKLQEHYDFQELVTDALSQKFTHEQNFKYLEFSDLPITIARGENCFIDIYFWRRRPTVIHNHHFAGAFQCLVGNNVDLEFSFTEKKKIGRYHALGELKLKEERQLRAGQVVEIALLDKFIHQNHHQDELTVNLCFRTPDLGKINLSNYLFSGLRFEKAPLLIAKVNRLLKFLDLESFDFKKLDLTLDDAISLLIQTHYSGGQHPRLSKLKTYLERIVKEESGLSVAKLLEGHDRRFDEIENNYV
ncbi:MAG: hypothetical protein NDI69_13395 [Bacteriovoracaceae bacterium]|nr:hypothetical protein [Bacteriovoracaceae bacterium]